MYFIDKVVNYNALSIKVFNFVRKFGSMKLVTRFIISAFLLAWFNSTAQVGINTTSPDSSSALDIVSTTQGVLTPRMTSVQRVGISTPAQGLLVYDTDEQSFYYFDVGWQKLSTNNKRTNYKLVKSVADLSDERTAGGGSIYVLNTDFLYEINGTIIFDLPIDINGAYIEGVDSGEDVIVNNSGATFFQGTTGGSIRNLTIAGNGNQVFNITGTGTELLVINNSIFAGASSLGSIDALGTVFFSIIQYVNNSDGFALSNMGSLLMSNLFWTDSNSGTFATITGTFDNLQMGSGRIEADTGEVGLDVSANPVIVNEASLSGLSFVGAGTLVQRYTAGSYPGFNFTTDWSVNCSGIPTETDDQSTANFYSTSVITSGFTQDVTNGTATPILGGGTFENTELFRFRSNAANNRLIYEGEKTRNFQINASLSIRLNNADGNFYSFLIARNGVVVDDSDSLVLIASDTQIQSVSLNTVVTMNTGDFIEVYVQRLTGTGTDRLDVFSENLTIR